MLVEQLLAPVPGGTGRFTRELVAGLLSTAPTGAKLTGWCAWHRDTSPAAVEGAAGPVRLPLGRRPLAAAWLRGLGPRPAAADVVLAPTLLAPPRGAGPLVVVMHDAVPWTHPQTLTPHGVAFHRRIGARIAAQADAVLVPTAAVAAELAQQLPLVPDRVHVIGEGWTPAVVHPGADADDRARRLDLPAGYLLMLGTLEPRKGVDVAVAALARSDAPDLPLLLVGPDGWGGVDAADLARRAGLSPGRVRALGRLPDTDLAVVLGRATALIAPSRAEGFGLPVLEAMAAGTPVVCSDIPALRETSAGAAVLVPPGDEAALSAALARLVADPSLRATLASAGRAAAAGRDWETVARLVWDVLLDVTAAGARSAGRRPSGGGG